MEMSVHILKTIKSSMNTLLKHTQKIHGYKYTQRLYARILLKIELEGVNEGIRVY